MRMDEYKPKIKGFQIRFFTKQHVSALVKEGFEILDIREAYEDPVTLYHKKMKSYLQEVIDEIQKVRRGNNNHRY
jgi:hypothetical protein